MLSNDIMVPALIGLGLYANNTEMNLANNTSILLILFLLLKDKDKGGHHGFGGASGHSSVRAVRTVYGDIVYVPDYNHHTPGFDGCCCSPCEKFERRRAAHCNPCKNPCCDERHERHGHHHHERRRERERREFEKHTSEHLERIERCVCRRHDHREL